MKNETVLVTGGARGIGKAIATKFASEGYNVAINYIKSDDLASRLKVELEEKYHVKVLLLKGDVSIESDAKRIVDECIKEFGSIKVLVNNAGISIDKPFLDKTKEDFTRILDTNLIGPFLMCKYVYVHLINTKNASIINISSTNGIDTMYPESMDYDASKAALNSLTKNMATVFSPQVRVNSVAPGWVKTDMNSELDKDYMKEEESKILLERFAEPMEIANVVFFLASPDASYINGEIIVVDGGKYGN